MNPDDPLENIMASPCEGNCCLNEADVCVGCFRTLNEIRQWSGLSAEARRAVMMRVQAQRATRHNSTKI